jgi:CDP-paratose 2-epimerase
MRILITGGAGLVGSHCAEYFCLKNRKHKISILDNLMRSRLFGYNAKSVEYNWNYLKKYKNIEFIKGDVRNGKDVAKALGRGVDVVVHTAGQPGVLYSVRDPREDFSINAYGTLNVLEAARGKSKKTAFIYCSTNKVYGENVGTVALVEQKKRYAFRGTKGISEKMPTDLTGHTPYGVSKLAGDLYVQEYAHMYKMKTAVFRMSCIYGRRQFGFEDQGWVAWFVIAALFNKPLTIYGNGKQVRDILYVEDLIRAYDSFIESDLEAGLFNIGGGPDNTISLLELISHLETATGRKTAIKFRDWRPSDQEVYISDLTKIKSQLGWSPKISVKAGLQKLIDWVSQNQRYFI